MVRLRNEGLRGRRGDPDHRPRRDGASGTWAGAGAVAAGGEVDRRRALRAMPAALTVLLLWLVAGLAGAAEPDSLEALIAAAEREGVRVVVIEPGSAAPAEAGAPAAPVREAVLGRALAVLGGARAAMAALPTLGRDIAAVADAAAAGMPPSRLLGAAALAFAGFVAVFGVLLWRVLRLQGPLARWQGEGLEARLVAFLGGGLLGLAAAAAAGLAAGGLVVAVFGTGAPVLGAAAAAIESLLNAAIVVALAAAALAPGRPDIRLLAVDDRRAARILGHLALAGIAVVPLITLHRWLRSAGAPEATSAVAEILAVGVLAALLALLATLNRAPADAPGWLVRNAHRLLIAYLGMALVVAVARRLAGGEAVGWLLFGPAAAAAAGLLVSAAALLASERMFRRPEAEIAGPALPSFRDWGRGLAPVVGVVTAGFVLLEMWLPDRLGPGGAAGWLPITAVTLLLAHAGWTALRTAIDRRIALEQANAPEAEGEGEGGGTGRTRVATLLPLVRVATLVFIMAVAGMAVLSSLGVNVAPLFAGAGIIGLAVGFGAQTLIRDIFSGLFFLIDDAFRVGEYVEAGAAKGTVEKISVRSMQLRHQNGPLHTIPFGEITQLTNYSRDWVIMKLPIRVTFETDPERVRKLIKKLGAELLEDPQVGPKFLDPLKSQGVLSFDNFGMVIRVKFKTRPGDQWVARRIVYQRLHELFEREGIEFAGREVRIRMEGQADEATKTRAAHAAALAVAEEQEGAGPAGAVAGASAAGDRR